MTRDGAEAQDCKRGKTELPERVKSRPAHPHVPVEMLNLVRSYALGVNAFVVNPVKFDAFFRAVQDPGVSWAVPNELSPRGARAPA